MDSILYKRVFEHLPKTRTNQCFVVMGESGSGKTEVVNSLVNKFLSQSNQLNCQSLLIEKISKVCRFFFWWVYKGDNSSKFGKN